MPALLLLLTESLSPFVAAQIAKLIHDQVAAGSPLDVAIRSVLANLEAEISNPTLRAVVAQLLNALLEVLESAAQAVTPAPAPTA